MIAVAGFQTQHFRPDAPQIGDDCECDRSFAQADEQMDADHHAEELGKRNLQHAAGLRLDGHHRRAGGDAATQAIQAARYCRQAAALRRGAQQHAIQSAAHQTGHHAHVDDVAPQAKSPPS